MFVHFIFLFLTLSHSCHAMFLFVLLSMFRFLFRFPYILFRVTSFGKYSIRMLAGSSMTIFVFLPAKWRAIFLSYKFPFFFFPSAYFHVFFSFISLFISVLPCCAVPTSAPHSADLGLHSRPGHRPCQVFVVFLGSSRQMLG